MENDDFSEHIKKKIDGKNDTLLSLLLLLLLLLQKDIGWSK